MGNQSIEDFDKELEFNQVRIRQNSVGFGLFNDLSSGIRLSFDNRFEGNEIQQTIERFITTPAAAAELGAEPYDNKNFIRSTMGFGYRNARGFFPTEGVDFLAEVGHIFHLSDDTTFGDLRTHLSIYQNLNRSKTVVWGSKTMYQTVGAGYEFYQAATLGGRESIRGYRRGRFRGDSAFSFSHDLRINFGQVRNNFAPFKIGMVGSFDVGRVWLKGEKTSDWHSSFGGGLWFEFFGVAGMSISYHKAINDDSNQILAGLGFNF